MTRLPAWLAALAAVALAAGPAAGRDPARAGDLEALRRAIDESRERVADFERRERGLFDAVEAVDGAVRALRADVERIGREADAAQAALQELEQQSAGLEARLARTRRALAVRVVALYKAGGAGPVRLVFSEGSLRDRLGRVQALQRLADHDARLLVRFREEAAALGAARAAAGVAAARRDAARAELAARGAELDRERGAKQGLLVSVRRDRARARAVLNELEAAARALEATLAELREAPARPGVPPATGFAQRRGGLDAPVAGAVLRRFGRVVDAEYRTETFRKGVDFAVETGEPVYAVADGEVRFAGWFRGYGRLVIVDHGDDYFTVSGHLDDLLVEVGDAVRAGDPLGAAGETGSLVGPRLYFEIRRGGEALDPADWLRPLPGG